MVSLQFNAVANVGAILLLLFLLQRGEVVPSCFKFAADVDFRLLIMIRKRTLPQVKSIGNEFYSTGGLISLFS